jgi:fumarylacetoacetate (FAA) hydrolase family protein
MMAQASARLTAPTDFADATLLGRVWRPELNGPSVVAVRPEGVFDITARHPTASLLCAQADPARALREAAGERIGDLQEILANTSVDGRDPGRPWLLTPIDLQVIKAAGVTFAVSMLERVIEERAHGDPASAAAIRAEVAKLVGDDLSRLVPGSPEAMHLKEVLVSQNAWSQYLEVGIGPDAEIFTKAPVLAAVGTLVDAGLHPHSQWNNPEPEVVLIVAPNACVVGATLGNDVNLRDFEGRSALLLSKAKDNNASCAVGPFIRLFDSGFTLEDVRRMVVTLEVEGPDGFTLNGASSLARISRDPADLVAQTINETHQYPDGVALFLGTMFAPTKDRHAPGQGFTHCEGDWVSIATPRLGRLVNRMRPSPACEPWRFGIAALMANLAERGVLAAREGRT